MKSSIIKTGTMLAGFLLAACLSTHAEVKLPAIFSDGMMMQQQTNANLWGTATPHKKVTVKVPASKYKIYKKLLVKKGINKKAKFRK